MAEQNSTPEAVTAPSLTLPERRLKVVAGFYEYPPRQGEPRERKRLRRVPQLRLKGQWLEQAGFTLDTRVRVLVFKGCLVLAVEGA